MSTGQLALAIITIAIVMGVVAGLTAIIYMAKKNKEDGVIFSTAMTMIFLVISIGTLIGYTTSSAFPD